MQITTLFAQWLKQRRRAANLTQVQLASLLNCSVSLVRKCESGARQPSPTLIEQITRAFTLSNDERSLLRAAVYPGTQHASPPSGSSVPTTPGWVPSAPTHLLGRDDLLAQVVNTLQHAPGRLVSLIGSPGVGKSRLALACAAALREQFPDGVWFVELAPLRAPDEVVPAIAARLELHHTENIERDLAAHLQSRSALLVLDNCEHVLGAAPAIAHLLAAAPAIAIITTSRAPLRIRAETCMRVEPLALPHSAAVQEVASAPASRLFCERARAIAPDFQLTAACAPAIVAICTRLDGLPLAIELAAARSDQLTPDALLGALDCGLAVLDGALTDLPPHQRSLHATIAWSEQLLSSAEQQSFRRLGVFVGSFTADAATALGAMQLDALVDAGLLQRTIDGRYSMLETLRTYAAEQFSLSSEETRIRSKHAAYYASLTETAGAQLDTATAASVMIDLDNDLANVRAAIHWSLETDGGVAAARITAGLRVYWLSRGHVRDGRLIEPLFTRPGKHLLPERLLSKAMLTVGYLASQQGDASALWLLDEGLAHARACHAHIEIAWGLTLRALLCRTPGSLAYCEPMLQEAIAVARAADAAPQLAYALNQLGVAYYEHTRYDDALPCLEAAIAVAAEAGEQLMIQRYQSDMAEAWRSVGQLGRARQLCEAILDPTNAVHDTTAIWETELRLARIDLEKGDFDTTAQRLARVENIVQQMHIGYGQTMLLRMQGYLALLAGDRSSAQRALEACYKRSVRAFALEELATCLMGLAYSALLDGDTRQAARLCGVYEALVERFTLRHDAVADRFNETVRAALSAAAHEHTAVAAYVVRERITRVAFPNVYLARDTLRLDHIITMALRDPT